MNITKITIQKFLDDNLSPEEMQKLLELYRHDEDFQEQVYTIEQDMAIKLDLINRQADDDLNSILQHLKREEFLEIAFPGKDDFTISSQEKEKSWDQILSKLKQQNAVIANISRSSFNMRGAAGSVVNKISPEILNKYGVVDTFILFEEKDNGYAVRVQSDIPQKFVLLFFQNTEEIFRIQISNIIPLKLVPEEIMENWTHIQILRESKVSF